jgi:iron-sulfur cluster assembly accessory protein
VKQIITLTSTAETHINKLLETNPNLSLCVSINNKGCSGHSYDYSWVEPTALTSADEKIVLPNGVLSIRANSVMRLLGSTLDFESTSFGQQLIWHNPQATNSCGCGKSVSF